MVEKLLYNPLENNIGNHHRAVSEKLDVYSSSHNNFILLIGFHVEMKVQHIKGFFIIKV